MTDGAADGDLDGLREETRRDDRISEEADAENGEDDGDEDEERAYTPIDDVVLRESAGADVAELRKQTHRDSRVDERERDAVELSPVEAFDLSDEVLDAVDEPYCGNCEHVAFRKRDGEPTPVCDAADCVTRLEPGMICSDYSPQGL